MKKFMSSLLAVMMIGLMVGCGSVENTENSSVTTEESMEIETEESTAAETAAAEETLKDDTVVRVGALKGPTTMGLLFMKDQPNIDFTMVTAPEEIMPMIVKGDVDIAMVPSNMASVLYNKTEGQISVIDINTLGVLYMVTADENVKTMEDLKGRTVYLTGQGATPEYVLRYILKENGLTDADVTLEFKPEPTEIVSILAEDQEAVGLLPQPFVTAACLKNEALKVAMDLNEEWDALQGEGGSHMITGVTLVRNEFLAEHKEAVKQFIADHAASAEKVNSSPEEAAKLVVEAGIVPKEPVAQKAIPECNIVCISGEEMKTALSGYLNVLFEQNPKSVGGALPEEDFYFAE